MKPASRRAPRFTGACWGESDCGLSGPLGSMRSRPLVRAEERPALTAGIEKRTVEGVEIQVFSKAKTVADCFRYRNKVGIDVALEALRDFLRGKGKIDELMRFADVNHVARVIRPYLEALA